ncbi:MAG: ABC transporter permease [Acidimicrobiales bacterium]
MARTIETNVEAPDRGAATPIDPSHHEPVEARHGLLAGTMGPLVASWSERLALPLLWLAMSLVFTFLPATGAHFATLATLGSIFGAGAVTVVLTLGLIVPALGGDYDLSVAYNLALSSILLAELNVNLHMNVALAAVIVVAVGALVGVANAIVSVKFKVDPFIATLGTGTVMAGITLWVSHSATISGVSVGLSNIVVTDRWIGLPIEFYFALGVALVMSFVFAYLPAGRKLKYVGLQRDVARLAGVSVGKVRTTAFIVSGMLSAVAGIMYVGNAGAADPTSGVSLLLPAFAAAFLGSTTILPGQFNPLGSLVAVYFLGTGITGLELLGASSYIQDLFYGGALIVAVIISVFLRRKQGAAKEQG